MQDHPNPQEWLRKLKLGIYCKKCRDVKMTRKRPTFEKNAKNAVSKE
jgi:hypothetical protein